MSRRCLLVTSLAMLEALAACGSDGGVSTAPQCNPLGEVACALPWPSSVFEREDTSSPTGVRLDVPAGALPANFDGIAIDPAWINERTGFSPLSQIMLAFPGGVDGANLVGHADIAASVTDASPTVIVDMMTGERVAHFAEVDVNELDNVDEQVLYLRPATRLANNRRYAVAIRKSLRGRTGPLPIAPAFQAMLDGGTSGHARLDRARLRYPEIFAVLADAGVPRSDLVVAFDFETSDEAATLADPLAARDAAMAVIGDGASVPYAVTETRTAPAPGIASITRITYETPQIADPAGVTGFHRGSDGKVTVVGTTTARASITIPTCATATSRAAIAIYGHGFFGDTSESESASMQHFATSTCTVVVGGVWRGMSSDDSADALLALNDLNRVHGFGDRIWQGIVDFMTLTRLARTQLAATVMVDGANKSVVDPARTFFYGNSMGHILGSTLFAYDTTLTRGVLGVGGANWGIMFERSNTWPGFSLPLKGAYGGVMNSVILQQVLVMGFELIDGGTVAARARAGGLPGAPPKQYLQLMSMGDCSVPNLASEFQARSLGLPLLAPSVKAPFGLAATDGPLPSAFVIMNESPEPLPPTTNEAHSCENVAHENVRVRAATLQQIDHFVETGEIANFCTGACDCAAGNCGALP